MVTLPACQYDDVLAFCGFGSGYADQMEVRVASCHSHVRGRSGLEQNCNTTTQTAAAKAVVLRKLQQLAEKDPVECKSSRGCVLHSLRYGRIPGTA